MKRATTLLVASDGGHLTQLRLLLPRLSPGVGAATWISYDCLTARSALCGEHMVPGNGPSTRHLGNAARNYQLARRVLSGGHFDRVISTGAGIAVPFLVEASRRGIAGHYIESASRVEGPSLSGRMLMRLAPDVHLYTQHARWANRRWQYAGSVFEGYSPQRHREPFPRALRILVTLGTHDAYRFDALVDSVARLVAPDDEVVWQLGSTTGHHRLQGRVEQALPAEEMRQQVDWADVVVAHCGTGTILTALEHGKHPVVVPRRHARGEHVDDHQAVTAREVSRLGLARWVEADRITRRDLLDAASNGCVHESTMPFLLADGTAVDTVIELPEVVLR